MGQARLPVGEIVAGKYRIERTVGEGGMGVVLAAQHLHLRRPVALKLLQLGASEPLVGRFMREAQIVAQLHSDHVPQVLDIDRLASGEPYIVMELLEGRDLSAELGARGPLPVPEAVDYVVQACEAISQAHALGVVHRDLKPANLFLTRGNDGSPCIKVLDFGIAKLRAELDGPGASAGLTRTGSFLGSPAYMSPEQWISARSVDPRSDVWSLGAILFELLAGRPPFLGESMGELCNAVMNTAAPSLRSLRGEVPVELETVVEHCLAKHPAARCQSPLELVQGLRPFAPQSAWPLIARLTGGAPDRAAAGPTAIGPTLLDEPQGGAAAAPTPAWGTASEPIGFPGVAASVGGVGTAAVSSAASASAAHPHTTSAAGAFVAPTPSPAAPAVAPQRSALRIVAVVLGMLLLLCVVGLVVKRLHPFRPGQGRPLAGQGQRAGSPNGDSPPSESPAGADGEPMRAWAKPGEPRELYFRAREVVRAASQELHGPVNATEINIYCDRAEVRALYPEHPGRQRIVHYDDKGARVSDDVITYPVDKPPPAIPFDERIADLVAGLPRDAAKKVGYPEIAPDRVGLWAHGGPPIWLVYFTLPPLRPGADPRGVSVRYDLAGNVLPRQSWSGRE